MNKDYENTQINIKAITTLLDRLDGKELLFTLGYITGYIVERFPKQEEGKE